MPVPQWVTGHESPRKRVWFAFEVIVTARPTTALADLRGEHRMPGAPRVRPRQLHGPAVVMVLSLPRF